MVACVHIEKRHRDVRGAKGLFRKPQETDRILAPGKENGRPLKLCRHFTHHVNGFRFKILKMVEMIAAHREVFKRWQWLFHPRWRAARIRAYHRPWPDRNNPIRSANGVVSSTPPSRHRASKGVG